MFSKSKPMHDDAPLDETQLRPARPVARNSGTQGSSFSVIGDGIVITGNIDAKVDLHIDGKVTGDVRCAALVQGPSSVIEGSILADDANLSGTVNGSIEAQELTIASCAKIVGDIVYEKIQIEQGGHIEGQFKHKSATARKPAVANGETAPAPAKAQPPAGNDAKAPVQSDLSKFMADNRS